MSAIIKEDYSVFIDCNILPLFIDSTP